MKKTKIIFEAGLNHNGSPELAHALVAAAANAGADVVKFQKRHIPSLATKEMLDSAESRFPSLGATYREVRSRLELSKSTYKDLRSQATSLGLEFMVTPFDADSLDFILDVGVDSIKVASHSASNPRLLALIKNAQLPTYMSTGMVTLEELDAATAIFEGSGLLTLLHCSSEYPATDLGANLILIKVLRDRYKVPVGFSSHEIGDLHSLAAVSLGAVCLERHVTTDKSLEGFDHKMSMDVDEFKALVDKVRRLEIAMGDGAKRITQIEQQTRDKYRVSMVAARDIEAGEVLTAEKIVYKNPGTGIPAIMEQRLIGKRVLTSIEMDSLINPQDIEEYPSA